jgi:hypothetical protein
MDAFSQQIQEWHPFFEAVAVCTATLMGLIFLAISLKLDVFRQSKNENMRQIAWQTFANFFFLLMFGLVFLVPRLSALTLSLPLLIMGATAIGITISQAIRTARAGFRLPDVLNESVPSLVAYLGMMTVAILIITHVMDSLVWLLPVTIVLLAVAVRNAWRLLVGAPAE